nr:uncharacterized protein LOC111757970 [Cavia porcellus]
MCYPVRREIVLENHMKKKPVTELQKAGGQAPWPIFPGGICTTILGFGLSLHGVRALYRRESWNRSFLSTRTAAGNQTLPTGRGQARDSATPGWPGRGLCAVLTVPALCCLHPTPPDRTPPVQNCKSQRATRQGDRELSSAPAAAGCGAIRGAGTASAAKGSILHSISSLPYVRGAKNSKPKLGSRSRFNSSEQQPSRAEPEPSTSSRSSCAVPNPNRTLGARTAQPGPRPRLSRAPVQPSPARPRPRPRLRMRPLSAPGVAGEKGECGPQ